MASQLLTSNIFSKSTSKNLDENLAIKASYYKSPNMPMQLRAQFSHNKQCKPYTNVLGHALPPCLHIQFFSPHFTSAANHASP